MTWPTDEMLDILLTHRDQTAMHPASLEERGVTRREAWEALDAMLEAAPTFDGWWWCRHRYVILEAVECVEDDCPGPHRAVAKVGPWIEDPATEDPT